MRSWTYTEMKAKVLNDLDLNDEDFIPAAEMLGYFNEAIDTAEAHIHTLYADYFKTEAYLALVSGTSNYALPSDIYANLIRGIIYNSGSIIYEIKRLKSLQQIPYFQTGDEYRYEPNNSAASGYKIRLYPTPSETSSTNITIHYIRNAMQLVDDDDVCDIPEFANYIMQFVKVRCYEKEGHPNVLKAMADLEKEESLMVSTLTNMVDDEDNLIQPDFGFYQDYDADLSQR